MLDAKPKHFSAAFWLLSPFQNVPLEAAMFCLSCAHLHSHAHMQKCIIDLNTKHSIPSPSRTQLKNRSEGIRGLCSALCSGEGTEKINN